MKEKTVTILGSGIALGVYIPALLLRNQLKLKNFNVKIEILENLFAKENRDKIEQGKKLFHENFSAAKLGHRIPSAVGESVNNELLEKLFNKWKAEKCKNFVVVSGFWLPIIKQYEKNTGFNLHVDLVHMDAEISSSWMRHKELMEEYNNIWMFDWKNKKVDHCVDVLALVNIPFSKRKKELVIHGGGWGMGTYKKVIPYLEKQDYSLNIIAYYLEDQSKNGSDNTHYYLISPDWHPWETDSAGEYEFPLFGEIKDDRSVVFNNKKEYSDVLDLVVQSKAIISKPGGATLLDSFITATPLIYLEPLAKYEEYNAKLWEYCGFGLSYDEWKRTGYSQNILEVMHNNLLKYKNNVNDITEVLDAAQN